MSGTNWAPPAAGHPEHSSLSLKPSSCPPLRDQGDNLTGDFGSYPRVLLVDDSETNRRVASLMLGRMGYSADLVGDGEEAINAATRRIYDLVFMDLVMPGIGGVAASTRLRETSPRTQIVAMTANLLPGQQRELEAIGVTRFLRKPVVVEELIAMLHASAQLVAAAPVETTRPMTAAKPTGSSDHARLRVVRAMPKVPAGIAI